MAKVAWGNEDRQAFKAVDGRGPAGVPAFVTQRVTAVRALTCGAMCVVVLAIFITVVAVAASASSSSSSSAWPSSRSPLPECSTPAPSPTPATAGSYSAQFEGRCSGATLRETTAVATVEACQALCSEEADCYFISYSSELTCKRYTKTDCDSLTTEADSPHTSYTKVDAPWQHLIVGTGSTASCTEATLSTAWEVVKGQVRIDGVHPPAVIEFQCGPPCETATISMSTMLIMNRGGLTMKVNKQDYAAVVLDAQGLDRILVFGTLDFIGSHNRVLIQGAAVGKELVFEGLEFRNGRGTAGGDWLTLGGGACIYAGYGAEVTIKECIFSSCVSTGSGGAIAAESTGMHIYDTVFEDNQAATGGGFWNNMIPDDWGEYNIGFTLKRCTFTSNQATNAGGGFVFQSSAIEDTYSALIQDITFTGNVVTTYQSISTIDRTLNGGGAALIRVGDTGTLEISNVLAEDNAAGNGGAFVLYVATTYLDRSTFRRGLSYGNLLYNGEQSVVGGGAFFVSGGPIEVRNCNFEDNVGKLGGAVSAQNAGIDFYDCSFHGNHARSHMETAYGNWDNRPNRAWEYGGYGGVLWQEQWGADGTQDGGDPSVHFYTYDRNVFQNNSADNAGAAFEGGFYDHSPTYALQHTLLFKNSAFCGNWMEEHPLGLGNGAGSKLTGGRHRFENVVFGGNVAATGTDTVNSRHDVRHCCCIGNEVAGHCANCFACAADEEVYINTDVPGMNGNPISDEACDGYAIVPSAPSLGYTACVASPVSTSCS